MPRTLHRLTDARIKRVRKPGMYCDGGGLYLNVNIGADGSVTRSWIYRYSNGHGERQMGLGPLHLVGLAEARQKAVEARKLRLDGIDPIEHRRRVRAAQREAEARVRTFRQVAEDYMCRFEGSWKNARHAEQWRETLLRYVYPKIGDRDVEQIATDDVLRILLPIWGTIPETASRVRGRIEAVLAFAGVDPNPARWRDHLRYKLAGRNKARDVKHLAALDWREVPAFMVELRNRDSGVATLALEFTILTASRAGEVLGATWDEIDLGDRTWTIPKERMKRDRVPLSDDAIAVLERMAAIRHDDRIFPIVRNTVLRRLQDLRPGVTLHGFRSSFRDWASENSSVPDRVVEAALAHAIGNAVEAAYRRGDLFERRRVLMDQWAKYCRGSNAAGNVIEIRRELPA